MDMNRGLSVVLVLVLSVVLLLLAKGSYRALTDLSEPNGSAKSVFTTNSSLAPGLIKKLKRAHQACFSKHLFSRHQGGKTLNLTDVGKWDRIGMNVTHPVRYNHLCPHLKSRYNCAKKDETIYAYGQQPTHWKLNLYPGDQGGCCNLWEFAHSLGGPVGLAKAVTTLGKTMSLNRTVNVMLAGNSYLRQIFEALVCGFHMDISKHLVQHDSKYGVSLDATAKRQGKKIELTEVGELASSRQCQNGDRTKFYEKGVQLPHACGSSNTSQQDDNLAIVEFGEWIRFYYIFHPNAFANLSEIYHDKFQLDLKSIDFLVFNAGQDKVYERHYGDMVKVFTDNGIWKRRIIWPYHRFIESQLRDVGRWFGADNPFIDDPPDRHACMPGAPDDEVNLLLFLLMSGSTVR